MPLWFWKGYVCFHDVMYLGVQTPLACIKPVHVLMLLVCGFSGLLVSVIKLIGETIDG